MATPTMAGIIARSAIVAASATTAVVFLPLSFIDFGDVLVKALIEVVALSILLPLAASLIVAGDVIYLRGHQHLYCIAAN